MFLKGMLVNPVDSADSADTFNTSGVYIFRFAPPPGLLLLVGWGKNMMIY